MRLTQIGMANLMKAAMGAEPNDASELQEAPAVRAHATGRSLRMRWLMAFLTSLSWLFFFFP